MSNLYNIDCIDFMSDALDRNVKYDYCITSPPYNMNLRVLGGKYVKRSKRERELRTFTTKYDNLSDDLTMEEYFNFLDSVIEKLLKLCKITFFNICNNIINNKCL